MALTEQERVELHRVERELKVLRAKKNAEANAAARKDRKARAKAHIADWPLNIGWTCCVWQGHYGHLSGKPTWLYAVGTDLPELIWGPCEQRIHPRALELHGYEKARRIGMMAMVGGKDKTRIRNATPEAFQEVLISMARSAVPQDAAA